MTKNLLQYCQTSHETQIHPLPRTRFERRQQYLNRMPMFNCPTCAKEWPENYCPECARSINRLQIPPATDPVPPKLNIPEVIDRPIGITRMRYFVALIIGVVLVGLILSVLKINQQRVVRPQSKVVPVLDLTEQMAAGARNKFSPLGTTTDEILSHENDAQKDNVVGALLWRLGQKSEKRGWDNLSDTERRLIAVDAMNGEVLDGGFKQYLSDSLGGDVEVALAGLKEMGATGTVQIVERAMSQFPNSKPPTDYNQRNAVMDKIGLTADPIWQKCDDAFYAFKEDLDALELAYAKRKRADIVLP
jgi:Domain of unknown function (DUF4375)